MTAIAKFLRELCPSTVHELEEIYGEARLELGADAALEYSLWSIETGAPEIHADQLLIYPNILRDQILYVYATRGSITHVAVVDPTDLGLSHLAPAGKRGKKAPLRAKARSSQGLGKKTTAKAGDFYLLKIELQEIQPSIWRQVKIRRRATFFQLHEVTQRVMGWENAVPASVCPRTTGTRILGRST